jgi:hypothetical protein
VGPAGPPGQAVEQLPACGDQQQEPDSGGEGVDVVEQVEQVGLGPVEVVDDDDHRPLGGQRLEQQAQAAKDASWVSGQRRRVGQAVRDVAGCDRGRLRQQLADDDSGCGLTVRRAAAVQHHGLRPGPLGEFPEQP